MLNDEMKLFVLFCVFVLGAYVTSVHSTASGTAVRILDGFENIGNGGDGSANTNSADESRCPNLLIQKGTVLYLYNTKRAPVPGVNPVRFDNLEEYVEFTDWLRGQGIKCPILFLQHSISAQGESIYSIRPGPTNLQGGLSSNLTPATPVFGIPTTKGAGSDVSAMFSPEQIAEITRIIDQSSDNDPYNVAKYPNEWSNAIIQPADNASMMKIRASHMKSGPTSNDNGNGNITEGYSGIAATNAAASTPQFTKNL
jgi:hypothetical protein